MEHQEKASKKGGIVFYLMTNLENIFFVFLRGHLIKKAILEIQKRLRRDDPDLFTKYAKYDS